MSNEELYTLEDARKLIYKQDIEKLCTSNGHKWDEIKANETAPHRFECQICLYTLYVQAEPVTTPQPEKSQK